ncbi:MAG: hypothetical protein JWM10_2819, partial [Myxococcaceae bacterium]|nr:hypothetical protein [Myxococcaceae bacterium]
CLTDPSVAAGFSPSAQRASRPDSITGGLNDPPRNRPPGPSGRVEPRAGVE